MITPKRRSAEMREGQSQLDIRISGLSISAAAQRARDASNHAGERKADGQNVAVLWLTGRERDYKILLS